MPRGLPERRSVSRRVEVGRKTGFATPVGGRPSSDSPMGQQGGEWVWQPGGHDAGPRSRVPEKGLPAQLGVKIVDEATGEVTEFIEAEMEFRG